MLGSVARPQAFSHRTCDGHVFIGDSHLHEQLTSFKIGFVRLFFFFELYLDKRHPCSILSPFPEAQVHVSVAEKEAEATRNPSIHPVLQVASEDTSLLSTLAKPGSIAMTFRECYFQDLSPKSPLTPWYCRQACDLTSVR